MKHNAEREDSSFKLFYLLHHYFSNAEREAMTAALNYFISCIIILVLERIFWAQLLDEKMFWRVILYYSI